jgi:N-acetylneuraminic acid mutarotase
VGDDPFSTGKWNLTGSPAGFHEGGSVTLLPNGEVLLAGGGNPSAAAVAAGAELYNPSTGQWTVTGSMTSARRFHAAVLLTNGQVLVAGGEDPSFTSLASTELYPVSPFFAQNGTPSRHCEPAAPRSLRTRREQ